MARNSNPHALAKDRLGLHCEMAFSARVIKNITVPGRQRGGNCHYLRLDASSLTWTVPTPHLDGPCPHLDRLRCGERDRLLLLSLSRDRDRSRRRLSLSRDVERERRRSARGRVSSCFPARFPKEIPAENPRSQAETPGQALPPLPDPPGRFWAEGPLRAPPGVERAAGKSSTWSGGNHPGRNHPRGGQPGRRRPSYKVMVPKNLRKVERGGRRGRGEGDVKER